MDISLSSIALGLITMDYSLSEHAHCPDTTDNSLNIRAHDPVIMDLPLDGIAHCLSTMISPQHASSFFRVHVFRMPTLTDYLFSIHKISKK